MKTKEKRIVKIAAVEVVWPKAQTYPCPGKCGHLHVKHTGPCTRLGCGCTAKRKGK